MTMFPSAVQEHTKQTRMCWSQSIRMSLVQLLTTLELRETKVDDFGSRQVCWNALAPDTSWVWRFHRQSKLARTERNAWKWFSSRVLTNSFVNSHWNLIDPWWKISFEKSRSPECSLEDFKVREASRGINSGCFHHEISCFHNLKVVLDGLNALFEIWLIGCAISDVLENYHLNGK